MPTKNKRVQDINEMLHELSKIKQDLEDAKDAKVPRVEELIEKCDKAQDRLTCLKNFYSKRGR